MKIEKGILWKNGKKVIALGSHYYPSFHPQKVPVFDIEAREKEAMQDIQEMHELGFDVVRIACLGELTLENEQLQKDFRFVDFLLDEIQKNHMHALVRLQGYSTNLRSLPHALMMDENGNEIPLRWDYFLRTCMNHPLIAKEDEEVTAYLASHFKENPTVLGFQIYNEPAYPFIGFYDYNPYSIEAYKKEMHKEKDPPRRRSLSQEELQDYIDFRTFSNRKLNQYLVHLGKVASKAGNKESFTCLMPCAVQQGSAIRGSDFFSISEGMDFLGITIYLPAWGVNAYEYARVTSLASIIARTYHKAAWAIECDAHISMSPRNYETMMLQLLGAGMKGIMPYQYRGDALLEGAPEANAYGIVTHQKEKTLKYEKVKELNAWIHRYQHELANSESYVQPFAIYMSSAMALYQDAITNKGNLNAWKNKEPYAVYESAMYHASIKEGYFPGFVDMHTLQNDVFSYKAILLPCLEGLSEEEKKALHAYEESGGKIRVYNPFLLAYEDRKEENQQRLSSLLQENGIEPFYQTTDNNVLVRVLKEEDTYWLFLLEIEEKNKRDVEILLSFIKDEKYQVEVLYGNESECSFIGDKLLLPSLQGNLVLRLKREEQ